MYLEGAVETRVVNNKDDDATAWMGGDGVCKFGIIGVDYNLACVCGTLKSVAFAQCFDVYLLKRRDCVHYLQQTLSSDDDVN